MCRRSSSSSINMPRPPSAIASIFGTSRSGLAEAYEMMSKRPATVLLMLLSLSGPAIADDLIGQASIIDGDTLEIHGTRIRLWGIDAPESSQLCRDEDSSQYRCGAQAANDLDAYIARRPVNCMPVNLDRYGRTVATCW